MHDHLAHEPERDRLHAERREQHGEQHQRAVAEWLAEDALDEHHRERYSAGAREHGTDQPEETQRLLGETKEKVEAEDVDRPSNVHAGAVDAALDVARMLRAGDFHDVEAVVDREQGQKACEVAVERNVAQHIAAGRAHAAGDVVQRSIREAAGSQVQRERLQAIDLRVDARPATRHREVGSALHRGEQLAHGLRLYLPVRRQGDNERASASPIRSSAVSPMLRGDSITRSGSPFFCSASSGSSISWKNGCATKMNS